MKFVPMQKRPNDARIREDVAREAYLEYEAQFGGYQSFERLHERGGFCQREIISLLFARLKRLEGNPIPDTNEFF